MPPTEDNLDRYLPAIASGDQHGFAAWMSAAEPLVRRSLIRFAASVDTEAVLQETLLRVWQVAPRVQVDHKPNSLLRMSYRIARNLAISETRRLKTPPPELEDASMVEAPVPADPGLRGLIERCRDALPKAPRLALEMRLKDGGARSDAMIADEAGMTKNTLLKNFGRAREFLKQCLKKQGVDLEMELA